MAHYDYASPFAGTERFVDRTDGTRLRTVSAGSGDHTVVLSHGYGASADEWNVVAPLLVEQGYKVIAFDHRGHGNSSVGTDGVGSGQMATDIGAVLVDHDLSDVILAGHSMGGFLSISMLLNSPPEVAERVSSLLLVATFAGAVNKKNPQNRLQIPLIKFGVLTRLLRFGPIAGAFTKSLVGDQFEKEMVEPFVSIFQAADHPHLIPILEAMVEDDFYPRLGELSLPCAIMVGTKDKTTPSFHADDLHSGIAGSKLTSLGGAGHMLNWEAPGEIVGKITELVD